MYDEHWGEIVVDWLEEDAKLKRKLRRPNKPMHEDLCDLRFVFWNTFKIIINR